MGFRLGCASLPRHFEAGSADDHPPPAEIGITLDEVDRPALIVDLDTFERNLRRLRERTAGTSVRARPHAKTHKCPVLKQMELGAVGVCCQKVSEAEALVYGGLKDVLVTNEVPTASHRG